VVETVTRLRQLFPELCHHAVAGREEPRELQALQRGRADRYLLRHETYNASHYQQLHPREMSQHHRLQCLGWLRELGFQTGCGMMVGSPGQTVDHLVEDLLFIHASRPAMVGMGPFLPHHATPFAHEPAGSVELTLRLISIVRLLLPEVLLPATTALGSLIPGGRLLGLKPVPMYSYPTVRQRRPRSYALTTIKTPAP
jgi:biotin synthase